MTTCTRLLLAGAVLALAAPAFGAPPDEKKNTDAGRYAVRIAAAVAIDNPTGKARALLTIAVEAAENSQDDVVKKCLAAYPNPKSAILSDADTGIRDLITKLAAAGYEAEAVEAAKPLPDELRNVTLGNIAAGPTVGVAAFWRACEDGKDDLVAGLLASVPVNAKDRDGETGLMKAAAHGHVAVVKRLLNTANREIWEVDKQGRTALMKAAANGQDAAVRTILLHYADVSYPKDDPLKIADAQGRTALMLAAAAGHAGVVHVLLDVRYANPLKNDRFLTIEREEGPPAAPFETSLVDRDRKDDDGKTALDLAEAGKHAGVVDLLKKDGK